MFFVSSYSTTEKLRLLSNYQDSDCSLGVFADYHEVRTANMTKWIKQFLLAGLAGLIRPKHNQKYSLKTKIAAVKDYQLNGLASREVLIKYKIRHISQLKQWIIQYNSDKLTVAYATRKRVKKMGRKVSFDEKKQIVQWTINHQNNYKEAASKYDISYQRVYSWVRKYLHDHNWEVLKDNRGRNKDKEPTNELERLRKRVRELEAEKRESEVQIAFAKKLVEIRNREVHRPDDIKRFKK
ncbi:transposase [Limosilactobacillus reuteri subsp. reuteri JCM 1112]|nr:transposase [Limosilactobacillus reuteri subsp. reuteri]BAG24948.1 putative transposase [Limosilactobacillus reuteri subsp. reuteri JCM 1112]BAG25794.1 transposase [Limosilactobacillus reuteri subsp. reuteri JCM 1112]